MKNLRFFKGKIKFRKTGGESLIQSFFDPEGKKVDLVPLQTSTLQLASADNINISNFNPKETESGVVIKVELNVNYQRVDQNETTTYYVKQTIELTPEREPDGKIVFVVSKLMSDHGVKDGDS